MWTPQLQSITLERARARPSQVLPHDLTLGQRPLEWAAAAVLGGHCQELPDAHAAVHAALTTLSFQGGPLCVAYLPPSGISRRLGAPEAVEVSIPNPLFCEQPTHILKALDAAHAASGFSVLVAEHVAHESGRLLPLDAVVAWAREKGVMTVIDGSLHPGGLKSWPDYYVLSTSWCEGLAPRALLRREPGLPPAVFDFPLAAGGLAPDSQDAAIAVGALGPLGEGFRDDASRALDSCINRIGRAVFPSTPQRLTNLVRFQRPERDVARSAKAAGLDLTFRELSGQTYLLLTAAQAREMDVDRLSDFLNYTPCLTSGVGATVAEQSAQKRREILESFYTSYDQTDALFERLHTSGFFHTVFDVFHPFLFFYGHGAAFYVDRLIFAGFLPESARKNSEIEYFYGDMDPVKDVKKVVAYWGDVPLEERSNVVERVREYRREVRALVGAAIMDESIPLTLPIEQGSFFWFIMLAMQHDNIHLERIMNHILLTPIHHTRGPSPQFPIFPPTCEPARPNELVDVRGGRVTIGRSPERTRHFGWDNEFGIPEEHELVDFRVGKMLVSNAEYAEFFHGAKGYQTPEYWSRPGWEWASKQRGPASWTEDVELRTMLEVVPMQDSWPVMVSHFEAEAFCAWKGAQIGQRLRLISHQEWLLLRRRLQSGDYNVNLRYYSSCPVHEHGEALGINGETVYDITGNVWQHSASPMSVLPGFKVDPIYPAYTAEENLDGHHYLIHGGSWASSGNVAQADSLYSFRRHRYQLAGIRYVASENEVASPLMGAVSADVAAPEEVLSYWFEGCAHGVLSSPKWSAPNSRSYNDEVDRRFRSTVIAAAEGRLGSWADDANGALALAIVLDQLSHQIPPGGAAASAQHRQARDVARKILSKGFDHAFGATGKLFGVLLPLERSEDPDDHRLCTSVAARYLETHRGQERDMFAERLAGLGKRTAGLSRA